MQAGKKQLQAENDNDTTVETLKQKTARGLFWGGMNTMVQQVIGLLFGIILGRLLAPSDYGMMAIISVFSSWRRHTPYTRSSCRTTARQTAPWPSCRT